MIFSYEETEIQDLIIVYSHIFEDSRGIYRKHYDRDAFFDYGIMDEFSESSDLYSKKGALRGLHYQYGVSQSKLVRVVSGVVADVTLDLRKSSSTYGKFHMEILSGTDNKSIFVPKGFAHGYISLSEDTIFSYQSAGRYIPEKCGGIRWDDPKLMIPWPLEEYGITKIIATDKDLNWPRFDEYEEGVGFFAGE